MELLEELGQFFQDQLTKEEQISVVFEILAQMQRVIEDLIPGTNQSPYNQDVTLSPLTSKTLKHALPENVLAVLNKVYSRRFDFEKQSKKFASDAQIF